MNDSLPPVLPGPTSKHSFQRFAATYSLLAPVIIVLVAIIFFGVMQSEAHLGQQIFGFFIIIFLLVLCSGGLLGGLALVTVKRREHKGIFFAAMAGFFLNGLLLVLVLIGPVLATRHFIKVHPTTPQARLDRADQKLAAATSQREKFYALDDAAKESFVMGKFDDARQHATDLLALAPSFQSDWNYGNAIQDGNQVLGRLALREGRIEEARQDLLASGSSKGSPKINSFGPNMSLAKDLLEKGERDSVLQYFDLCRKFWTMDYGKLDEWTKTVKAGGIPDFGANLVY